MYAYEMRDEKLYYIGEKKNVHKITKYQNNYKSVHIV